MTAEGPAAPVRRQGGFSLVMVLAAITVMLILMGAAVPTWRYVMKNAREEELLFRGMQIADAIERYQRKHGGAAPASIDELVKGHFLRKPWKDPMTRDGKWRLLHPGEVGGLRFRRGAGGSQFRNRLGGEVGDRGERGMAGFVGVASTSEDDSFRIFNGQTQYDEWFFVAGQPRVVGKPRAFGPGGKGLPGAMPGNEDPGAGGRDRPGTKRPNR